MPSRPLHDQNIHRLAETDAAGPLRQPNHPATGEKRPLRNTPRDQNIQRLEKNTHPAANYTTKTSSHWKNQNAGTPPRGPAHPVNGEKHPPSGHLCDQITQSLAETDAKHRPANQIIQSPEKNTRLGEPDDGTRRCPDKTRQNQTKPRQSQTKPDKAQTNSDEGALAEDGGSDAHDGGTFGNRQFHVAGHTHRQFLAGLRAGLT